MNVNLYALLLGLAQKDHLRDAWRVLVDNGFSVAEANELVAEVDREIDTYVQNWAAAVRSATKKGA
jgi:hypothetical protein